MCYRSNRRLPPANHWAEDPQECVVFFKKKKDYVIVTVIYPYPNGIVLYWIYYLGSTQKLVNSAKPLMFIFVITVLHIQYTERTIFAIYKDMKSHSNWSFTCRGERTCHTGHVGQRLSPIKKKKKKCPPDASPTNNFSNFFLKKIVY